jgi:hypothetical protein
MIRMVMTVCKEKMRSLYWVMFSRAGRAVDAANWRE